MMNLGTPTQCGSISFLVTGGSAPIPKGVGDDPVYLGPFTRNNQRVIQESQQRSDPKE